MFSMRTLWLVSLLAVGAWAQSTGGTFGSGGLSGGGTSGGGSKGSGKTSTGTGGSLFGPEKRDQPTRKEPRSEWELQQEAEARARFTEEQQRREAEFQRTHRLAGQPPSISGDPRLREPAWELVLGMRWPHALIGLGLFLGLFSLRFAWSRRPERVFVPDPERKRSSTPPAPRVDTTPARGFVLSLGFDWTAREQLQAELSKLAQKPMADDLDRSAVISELVALMKRHLTAARYVRVRDLSGTATEVEREIAAVHRDLRSRYTHETVGAARKRPEVMARPLEGPGLVVISLVVGSTLTLDQPLGDWMPLDKLLERVDGFAPVPQLLQVVWSPAVDGDRLSSAELEVLYPELEKVGPSRLGRVACGRCNAVYALELEQCPSCGAKEDRSAGKTPAPPCPWCGTALPSHETKCGHCGAFVEAPPPSPA